MYREDQTEACQSFIAPAKNLTTKIYCFHSREVKIIAEENMSILATKNASDTAKELLSSALAELTKATQAQADQQDGFSKTALN